MSISVAGINLPEAVLNLEYEMMRTQSILEWLLNNNPGMKSPTLEAIKKIDADALKTLQKKYPAAGVGLTKTTPDVVLPGAPR